MSEYAKKIERIEAVLDELDRLDIACNMNGIHARLLLLGGASLLVLMHLNDRQFRPTRDIDLTILSTDNERVLREILQDLSIDILDGTVEVPPLEDFTSATNFKIEGSSFTNIEIYVPSIELLACTKIFSKREKDLQDLRDTDLLLLCDRQELLSMADKYLGYMLHPEDPDLNYHHLRSIPDQRVYNYYITYERW